MLALLLTVSDKPNEALWKNPRYLMVIDGKIVRRYVGRLEVPQEAALWGNTVRDNVQNYMYLTEYAFAIPLLNVVQIITLGIF